MAGGVLLCVWGERTRESENYTIVIKVKHNTKQYLQDLFDGKYKDEPTLNSKEFLQAEKEFLTAIEEFKTKFNNEEITNATDELTKSFTKYESVVQCETFIA